MKAACRKYSCLWIEICVCLFFNRSLLTWLLECLHILYTCSLTVCLWLPQFCHQRSSNLPLKPVPPKPLVLLCERVRWEVAVVSSVLSSPLLSPVMCTHVEPVLPKFVQWLLAMGADLPMIRNVPNVLQYSVCPFRGLVTFAGIGWPCRSKITCSKAVLSNNRRV